MLLTACGGDYSGGNPASSGSGNGGGSGGGNSANSEAFFTAQVQPRLAFCRTCHVPGGVADTDKGRGFMLSKNAAEDFARLRASWEALGRGIEGNRILTKASNTDPEPHSGGAPWPKGGPAYSDIRRLFACWSDPANCILGGSVSPVPELPLLGSTRGGHAWFDYCADDGTDAHRPRPDDAVLPPDPRSRVQPGVNEGKAVHFNAFWKDCHVDPELVGERPHPKTCGELRESHARGERLMLGNGGEGSGSIFQGNENIGFINASDYNNLWRVWGLTARPENFDQLVAERYGMPMAPGRNPYPLPGEDPNRTDGGSGQLPAFMTQGRGPNGEWNGRLGFTCHACHSGAAGLPDEGPGLGFLYGSGNSLHDIGVMARELGLSTPGPAQVGLALALFADSRGTNNAQFANLVSPPGPGSTHEAVIGWLTSGSTASMDNPAWWNLGHRPLKFIDGVVPSDAVRVDLSFYIPLFSPGTDIDAWTKEHAQDADHWILSMKSPAYPLPVDTALAEQGAILFHAKDLWAEGLDNPVPRPPGGNGSCASCHGAYSPRFVHDPAFLGDPALAGVAGNITPIEIIRTDRVRLESFTRSQAAPGAYPETEGTEQDCGNQNRPELRGDRALGYLAPPLFGVWATAPYLHNGSVPDVWTLLKPAERPRLWRRVSAPAAPGLPAGVVMGFDTRLQRAYDPDKLGWKYDALPCGAGTVPLLDCDPADASRPPVVQQLLAALYGNVLASWNLGNAVVFTQWTPQQVEDRKIYNTYRFSQGNGGHDFTAVLTDAERRALIEYLKTL